VGKRRFHAVKQTSFVVETGQLAENGERSSADPTPQPQAAAVAGISPPQQSGDANATAPASGSGSEGGSLLQRVSAMRA